jgi:thiol:disulfide interchange protein
MTIYTKFSELNEFKNVLNDNKGVVVVFIHAQWCRPCKLIEQFIKQWFDIIDSRNTNIICCDLDVDANPKIYATFKRFRRINGIPSILVYNKGTNILENNVCISAPTKKELMILFNNLIDEYSINNAQ